MAGNPIFFGRSYYLTIEGDGINLELDSVTTKTPCDIKFDVSYASGQKAREGTVEILGLKTETIHPILNLSAESRGEAMKRLVHLHLDAGYKSEGGMINIFDGYVWYATVTSPPTRWLRMNVCEYNPLCAKTFTFVQNSPMNLRTLMETLCQEFEKIEEVKFTCIDETEDQILDEIENVEVKFPENTTVETAISALNEQVSDKVRFILCTEQQDPEPRIIKAIDKDTNKANPETITVDKDNGLLSVTGISVVSGCVTTFIDSQSSRTGLCHLYLESELNPQANGVYLVVRKRHVGHFMGQEWYTQYTCSGKKKDEN